MLKRILVSGALGGVTLLLWTGVVNVVFGFTVRLEMNRIPNERAVYSVLKENITAPGAYLANPELTPDRRFPDGEPVFGVHYGGVGHEAAGRLWFLGPGIALVATLLAAGLLSLASARILSRFSYRLLFIVLIGLLLAVFGDVTKFGIGGYPASSALLLAANTLVSWTVAGLVIAWRMRVPLMPGGSAGSAG